MKFDAPITTVTQAHARLREVNAFSLSAASVSGMDRAAGVIAITSAGLPVEEVLVDASGTVLEGGGSPARDLGAHLVLYRKFPDIGGIVHCQSQFATCWAQARKAIPCLGTLHADYFLGEIPVTEPLTEVEVEGDYPYHIGKAIARAFTERNPLDTPAVLVAGQGPFVWGRTVAEALENTLALEEIARLAWHTLALNPVVQPLESYTAEKHFHQQRGASACHEV